ncbi:MAG: decarboxylating NADP(+)-dependent phosphogluconate dehydrogenase [Lachnospiraceae bacterium]|nr:decarboxylating NADP(+)-dependent phosphogluconate dehydrogenase [Lachnospiraceae bacterium]
MGKSDIAMIGMAVMGENLALNMEEKGFTVSVYDVRDGIVDAFMAKKGAGKKFYGAKDIKDLVDSLEKPRKVMMMIKAGEPVDEVIDKLLPVLEDGDIIIDGGNSHFPDTERRTKKVEAAGKLYIGTGVSGGEEGARKGPSLMPGGSKAAWETVKPILTAISSKVNENGKEEPCCAWVGEGGAGHFVKMVHNGIEYGDMELICEAYNIMKTGLGMNDDEIGDVFGEWNKGKLDSYLIQITSEILHKRDEDGSFLVENILDTAGQKGTGKWTGIAALDEGVPLTLISEAVFARCLSAVKEERVEASKILNGPGESLSDDEKKNLIDDIRDALYVSKIISYAQGYSLMRQATKTYGWKLAYGDIALMWRGGCIIRSVFLGQIKKAFERNPDITNLMLDDYFKNEIESAMGGLRRIVSKMALCGIPVPAMSSALFYYDGYRSERLPANLLQAQRDYFGAHTYERCDRNRGEFFHTEWSAD